MKCRKSLEAPNETASFPGLGNEAVLRLNGRMVKGGGLFDP